ncbi:MAG TPA: DUF3617 domain-containing protein [Edaphobacter sp.]|nr:DUF3617 domain-containing protein [Edaphobacter sp.]
MKTLAWLLAAVSIPAAAVAQSAPIKMGLWHGKTVSTIKGLELPPDVVARLKAMGRPVPGGEPTTTETESCLTPEKWREMLAGPRAHENCSYSNMKSDSSGMSGDVECTSGRGDVSKGHIQMNFVSSEKVQGTMHVETTSARRPQPMLIDMTIDSTYEGADCKGISPDSPKVVH